MLRHEWKFTYTAATLAEAADKQRAHREKRLAWWEKKKEEVMAELRSMGLDVTESIAESAMYAKAAAVNTMGGFAPQVTIKPEYQIKLNECHTRINTHRHFLREYEGWRRVLEANHGQHVELNHDDWLYFFADLESEENQ